MTAVLEWLTFGWGGAAVFITAIVIIFGWEACMPGLRRKDPSTGRLLANFGLGCGTFALQAIPVLSTVALAAFFANRDWGLFHTIGLPVAVNIALTVIVLDGAYYAAHRMFHGIPILWRFHKIHHADPALDVSTAFRVHPAGALLSLMLELAIVAALGLSPLGVGLYAVLYGLVNLISHADIAPSSNIAQRVSLIFVTPSFHAQHHSSHQPQTDSNFGGLLTIWDRVWGTATPVDTPVARFGLGDEADAKADDLVHLLALPFRRQNPDQLTPDR